VLSFAYATRFEDKFLEGRVPVDRVDASVSGEALTLDVRPLPEAGRPKDFTGAVGSFSIRAETEAATVVLGGSLKLRVILEGEGNRSLFDPPRWTELGGFRVLGMVDEKGAAARTWTYDLAPVSAQVWQVPAISFAYFDPEPPASYRVARTRPIDVVVRPGGKPATAAEQATGSPAEPPAQHRTIWFVLAVVAALALLLLVRRRRL
jgi:MYXO-CTERM domain-containing protein